MPESATGFCARWNARLRRMLLACAAVGAAGLAGWLLLLSQIHDQIRCEVERRFQEHYADLRVSVRSAQLNEGHGIEIRGISISSAESRRQLLYVDRVYALSPIDAQALVSGEQPRIDQVQISGLQVWAERRGDGSWEAGRLWPLPALGSEPPPIRITNATVQVADATDGVRRTLELRDVNLQVDPDWSSAERSRGGIYAAQPPRRICGSLGGDHFDQLDFAAWFDPATGAYRVDGRVQGVEWSPQLQSDLPAPLNEAAAPAANVKGRLELEYSVAGNVQRQGVPRFSVVGELRGGQIHDPRFPLRLHDVQARIDCSDRHLRIERATARSGASRLELNLVRGGWEADSPLTLEVAAEQFELSSRLLEALPEQYRKLWRDYRPSGVVDARVQLAFDGRDWRPNLHVRCQDVAFVYHRFPYRLEQSRGTIRLQDGQLSLHLLARAAGQPVNLDGELRIAGDAAYGWFEFACEDPIPIDATLLDAIPDPNAQAVVRSLNPGGMFIASGRFESPAPGAPISPDVTLQLVNASMQYEKFPYPLAMIRGTVQWNDEGWFFRDLSARNDSGYVTCSGSWRPRADGASELELAFTGTDVPLENELRDALPPTGSRVWNQLRPRGTIDHLQVDLRYASQDRRMSLGLRAENRRRKSSDQGRSITVVPAWMPYRLDDLAGVFSYRDGHVRMENVSAVHNQTGIQLAGTCDFVPDGPWRIDLTELIAERLEFDRDLIAAVPKQLGRAIGKLDVTGDLNLNGSLAVSGDARQAEETAAVWDVTVDIENGTVQGGLPMDHIHGDVRFVGNLVGSAYASRGELNLDSLFCKGLQLTQVRGPLLIGPTRILIGSEAERDLADRPPRPLSASVIGGRASLDGTIWLDEDINYRIQSRIDGGELAILARDLAVSNTNIQGKINGVFRLGGNRLGWPSWNGAGAVRLYEADLYELPVMLALLKLLRVQPPDTTGFTSSEIDFRLQGDRFYFDRLNFSGDAVSLKGKGEMNVDREIDLEFYALVGRETNLPVVESIVRLASRQLLRIYVKGRLDDPQMTREPLPLLKETLEQLFPEVAGGNQLSGPPAIPGLRSVRDRLGGWLP